MIVIYAEKPDMGKKIASAIGGSSFHPDEKKNGYYMVKTGGEDYAVTWGMGHLCRLADAEEYDPEFKSWAKRPMPFIPDDYRIVLNVPSKMPVEHQYGVVKKLFDRASSIINATDFDREGELIFYYLYSFSGCTKPVKRMKLTSTTENGIRDAFRNLLDSAGFEGLLSSAKCRSAADWVIGTNLTVAMTLHAGSGKVLSIGRVQTPTLRMVVDRDNAIDNFKPEDYFTADAVFTKDDGRTYKGSYKVKRFDKREDAEKIASSCAGHNGTVTKIEKTKRIREVPRLYSMSMLQIDANKKHGMSMQRTLSATQSLYEAGLVTYPRTDCQFLPEDMYQKLRAIQNRLLTEEWSVFATGADESNMASHRKRYFDDTRLGSHFAIIPTEKSAGSLTGDERNVYDLVAKSVIRILFPDAVLENTKVITDVNGNSFVSSGTAVGEKGWLSVGERITEADMPPLSEGETVGAKVTVNARKTEPPKRYTEATLLSAMLTAGKTLEDEELKKFMIESKIQGIGTEATRAAILETLLRREYLVRDGKSIISTALGKALISAIPVDDVKSVALTAKYEKQLADMVDKKADPDEFLAETYRNVKNWCAEISSVPQNSLSEFDDRAQSGLSCPACGKPLRKYDWGYGCSGHQDGCDFAIGTIAGKKLTSAQVGKLLRDGYIGPLSGFRSREGRDFEAVLELERETDDEGNVTSCKIVFGKNIPDASRGTVDAVCPVCGGKIVQGTYGWECSGGCGLSLRYKTAGVVLTASDAEKVLRGESPVFHMISKQGRAFDAKIVIDAEKRKMSLEFSDSGASHPEIGVPCPLCGSKVSPGRYGWRCTNDACTVSIPYEMLGVPVPKEEAEKILTQRTSGLFHGFKSKKSGNLFDAFLVLGDDGKLGFRFSDGAGSDRTVDFRCPICGEAMVDMKFKWACSDEACGFSISKQLCDRMISEEEAGELAENGRTGILRGFRSKKSGKSFDAALVLNKEKKGFDFEFESAGGGRKDGASSAEPTSFLEGRCPFCDGEMGSGRFAWECAGGCGFRISKEICGHTVTEDEAERLLSRGKTVPSDDFFSKKKNKFFTAYLYLDKDEKNIKFRFPKN